MKEILEDTWDTNPNSRPTFTQIIQGLQNQSYKRTTVVAQTTTNSNNIGSNNTTPTTVKAEIPTSSTTEYPTIPSLHHSIIRGYKNILAISLGTGYSIPQVEKLQNAAARHSAVPAKEKKREEEEEEEEEDLGYDLFD